MLSCVLKFQVQSLLLQAETRQYVRDELGRFASAGRKEEARLLFNSVREAADRLGNIPPEQQKQLYHFMVDPKGRKYRDRVSGLLNFDSQIRLESDMATQDLQAALLNSRVTMAVRQMTKRLDTDGNAQKQIGIAIALLSLLKLKDVDLDKQDGLDRIVRDLEKAAKKIEKGKVEESRQFLGVA